MNNELIEKLKRLAAEYNTDTILAGLAEVLKKDADKARKEKDTAKADYITREAQAIEDLADKLTAGEFDAAVIAANVVSRDPRMLADALKNTAELLAACTYAVQFSDADINPTIRKRLQAAINTAKKQ
jgi:hypothetical protein